jgi:phage shock protein PspC (stress-responsive transcriptional regulator)
MSKTKKRLYRSDDRVISGVLGGFAEYFGVEPTIFRLAIVFLVVATGIVPGLITYIAAVLIVPERPPSAREDEGDAVPPQERESAL